MIVRELENFVRYGGLSPLKLRVRNMSSPRTYSDKQSETYPALAIAPAHGGLTIIAGQKAEPPMTCRDAVNHLESLSFPPDAPVLISTPASSSPLPVESAKTEPWSIVLVAEQSLGLSAGSAYNVAQE